MARPRASEAAPSGAGRGAGERVDRAEHEVRRGGGGERRPERRPPGAQRDDRGLAEHRHRPADQNAAMP